MDMSLEDQHEWEEQEMMHDVDFLKCHIDPAPFQLVEKSSLLKVNSSNLCSFSHSNQKGNVNYFNFF